MKIGNYLNVMRDQKQDPSERRLDRLEKRRERWDQTFDRMQQQAIKAGDTEKAQQIFEMSEAMEARLDKKLDKLEEKTGSFNWDRHMDNAFDKLQAKAYESDDPEMAESIFDLSQVVKGGKFDPSKRLLLEKLLSESESESETKPSMIAAASKGSDEAGWEAFLKGSTQKTAATGATASSGSATTGTSGAATSTGVKTS